MSLLDGLAPGPFREPVPHEVWVDGLRDQYEGTGIGVLDDGTLIRLSTAGPV